MTLWLAAALFLPGCATRSGYVRSHPYLDKMERRALLDGEVLPGFDKEMVDLALGSPSNVSRTVTKGSTKEVWLYPHTVWVPLFGTVKSEYTYVYFEDGKVSKVRAIKGSDKYQEKMDKALEAE